MSDGGAPSQHLYIAMWYGVLEEQRLVIVAALPVLLHKSKERDGT